MLGTPGSSQASVTPLIGLSAGVRAQHIWGGGWDLVVLASDHQLYGIGANSFQELTVPSATGLTRFTWQPYGLTITAAAVGYTNVALLGSDGRVWITGDNSHGELGTGTTDNGTHPLPEPVPGLHDVVAVAVGSYNLLAADRYGLVWGIGDNSHHQLTGPTAGTGATPQALRVAEAQPTNAATVEVASGGGVSLVRAADGVVLGAGDDNLGAINGGPGDILGLTALGGQRVLAYARPTITGTRKVGRVLTAHAGSWSVRPSKYGYQWYRNATKITGATRTTYKLTKYDRGHRLHVVVTASRSGFGGSSATSAQTGKIA
jgi:hypothetical protein